MERVHCTHVRRLFEAIISRNIASPSRVIVATAAASARGSHLGKICPIKIDTNLAEQRQSVDDDHFYGFRDQEKFIPSESPAVPAENVNLSRKFFPKGVPH